MILKICGTVLAGSVCIGSPTIGWLSHNLLVQVIENELIAELQSGFIGMGTFVAGFSAVVEMWRSRNDTRHL